MSATSREFVPGSPEHQGFYTIARVVITILDHLLFRVRVEGKENIPKTGPAIVSSNHLSSWDIVTTALVVPRMLHFMAKVEYAKIPLVRWLFVKLEAFFVRRGEGDTEAMRNCLAVLKANQLLFIYPEGHRSDNKALIKAHDGFALIAFKSGVPVIPVATWGSELVTKKWRILFWRPTIYVRVGKPLTFVAAGKKITREELHTATETTMRAIAAMLPPKYRGVYSDDTSDLPETASPEASAEVIP
jgi:1-acyl-sn-glycerol-3-phosphate acyltransferase